MKVKGAIAAGHESTVKAAEAILSAGGNAFDAAIAAHFAACVAEPVLASLGGGGFMLAKPAAAKPILYDFFVQTPQQKNVATDVDFHPIQADFGETIQEFHVGTASIATPGSVRGMFEIHRDLGIMPMTLLMEPAIEAAKEGVKVNSFQAYIFDVVSPILGHTPEAKRLFGDGEKIFTHNNTMHMPELADVLDSLAHEGPDLFYQGEIAASIHQLSESRGGHIQRGDLESYRVIKRKPMMCEYQSQTFITNPAPSSGGLLIALALDLLQHSNIGQFQQGSGEHLTLLSAVMEQTNKARLDALIAGNLDHTVLSPDFLAQYKTHVYQRAQSLRGTTHISIADAQGNMASLTVSNGEGCGHIIPNSGIMLNNMLGEEDLNPQGFHQWQCDQRMTSMMAPSLLLDKNGHGICIGSGGSNRLRTAILQTIINHYEFDLPLDEAIRYPRIHNENGVLNIEPGYDQSTLDNLEQQHSNIKHWNDVNLFFGGTHVVERNARGFGAVGDPRRGGQAVIVQ